MISLGLSQYHKRKRILFHIRDQPLSYLNFISEIIFKILSIYDILLQLYLIRLVEVLED